MKVFYDTEFVERGPQFPITLVSIGMVREDGVEYYAVNGDLDLTTQAFLRSDPWLSENVWVHLPRHSRHLAGDLIHDLIDISHPDVKARETIATEISTFCTPRGELVEGIRMPGGRTELWAYYADYDHVVLSQLFGRMIDLPPHMPMYTRDLKQIIDQFDLPVTVGSGTDHHALDDARGVRDAWLEARNILISRYNRDFLENPHG